MAFDKNALPQAIAPERLLGKRVTHFSFGKGLVTQARSGYIVVSFGPVERMFEFPAAFGEYLTVEDKRLQKVLPVCRKTPAAPAKTAPKPKRRSYVRDEYDTAALADTLRLCH